MSTQETRVRVDIGKYVPEYTRKDIDPARLYFKYVAEQVKEFFDLRKSAVLESDSYGSFEIKEKEASKLLAFINTNTKVGPYIEVDKDFAGAIERIAQESVMELPRLIAEQKRSYDSTHRKEIKDIIHENPGSAVS